MSLRAKSDSLYRLVKTLGEGLLHALRVYKEQYGGGSHQWQLIVYYWGLEEWSKEREKSDWAGHNLSQIKYRAHRWLMHALTVIGEYPYYELHRLIGEIRVGLDRDNYEEAALLIDEAKEIALRRELFKELLQILDFEMRTIRLAYEVPERLERFRENVRLGKAILEKVTDLERFRELRANIYEPLVAQYERDSTYPADLMDALESSSILSQPQLCLSVRSLHEYHSLKYSLAIKKLEREEAFGECKEVLDLYDQYTWLKEEDLGRYATDLRSMVKLAGDLGQKELALDCLSKIESLNTNDPRVKILILDKLIYAKFFAAETLGIRAQAQEAIELYIQGKGLLRGRIPLNREIWFCFLCAHYGILEWKMELAIGFLDRIKEIKIETGILLQVHSRVLRLICQIGLRENPVEIEAAANAASRFVKRQDANVFLPLLVIRSIEKMARYYHDTETWTAIHAELVARLTTLSEDPNHKKDFYYFPYLDWATNFSGWNSDAV